LVADQERSKSIGKSDECFSSKMEEIKREFDTHYEDLKEDKSLCAHYHYQYGRYLLRKSEGHQGTQRFKSLHKAREQLEKSLKLRKTLADTSVGKADMVFSLQHLGNTWKKIASSSEKLLQPTMDCENATKKVQECYEEAIELSEEHLGEHELTSSCYKNFGDLFLTIEKHNLAQEKYTTAKRMRENLGLNASVRHVFLLNNLGQCFTKSTRAKEGIKILENARDMAEKLAESDEPNVCKTKVYTSLAIAYDSEGKHSDAVTYAHKALKFEKAINKEELNKLHKIVSKNFGNN
jgi:tetratricopeptide (TPR) repeat protein